MSGSVAHFENVFSGTFVFQIDIKDFYHVDSIQLIGLLDLFPWTCSISFRWSCSIEAEVICDSVLKAYYVSFLIYSSAVLHIEIIFQYTI